MEFVLELVFEIFGEFILQLAFEFLASLGMRGIGGRPGQAPGRWATAFGYLVLGAIAGGLSLLVAPSHFIASEVGQWSNLVVTPILAGAAMVAIANWRRKRKAHPAKHDPHASKPRTGGHSGMTHRRKHEEVRTGLEKFMSAYLFALAMAGVRLFAT